MKTKEFAYDDLIMTNEEFADVVDDAVKNLSMEEMIDMITNICEESEKEEPGILKASPPIVKIAYIGRELYKYGFMVAVHLINEANKAAFEE